MSAVRAAVWLLAAACYRPAPPPGVQCTASNECPGDQPCVEGICGGEASSDAPTEQGPDPQELVVVLGMDETQVRDVELSNLPGEADVPLGDVNHFSVDTIETGLVRFDTATVPARMIVTRATLTVYTTNDGDGADETGGAVFIHRVLEPWVERQATWINASNGVAWSNVGAGAPGSREAAELARVQPNQRAAAFDVNLPIALVQGWLDDPARNFGIAFARGESQEHVHFATRENTTRPTSRLMLHLLPIL